MKRSLQITGRQDLASNEIKLVAEKKEVPGHYSYPAITGIKVTKEDIDPDLTLVLKIKQHRQIKVLKCGKVGKPKIPSPTEFKTFSHSSLGINVSVFVHDPKTRKVLFSTRRAIKIPLDKKTDSDTSPIEIAWFDTSPSLWELEELNIDEKPCISLNDKIVEKTKFKAKSIFWASVLPSVVESILCWIWNEANWEEEGWVQEWKQIVLKLEMNWHDVNTAIPGNNDFRDEWTKQVREAWERHNPSLLDAVLNQYGEEGGN